MESKNDLAKEKFYNFFKNVAGLRFADRKEFDEVVDALILAAQDFCLCEPIDENLTKVHPNCPLHGNKGE